MFYPWELRLLGMAKRMDKKARTRSTCFICIHFFQYPWSFVFVAAYDGIVRDYLLWGMIVGDNGVLSD